MRCGAWGTVVVPYRWVTVAGKMAPVDAVGETAVSGSGELVVFEHPAAAPATVRPTNVLRK